MITVATMGDLPEMIKLGKKFWKQTAYYKDHGIDYDVRTVWEVSKECITNGVSLCSWSEDGKIDGIMLMPIVPFPMNANYTSATEWVFFVDPSKRGSRAGYQMIRKAEVLLKEKGVTLFSLVSLTNVTPDVANKLYEGMGFEHSETGFTKDIR